MESQPMKAHELGHYVCVAHTGCLHSPHRTIRTDGVWVQVADYLNQGGHLYASAHRDCFEAWKENENASKDLPQYHQHAR